MGGRLPSPALCDLRVLCASVVSKVLKMLALRHSAHRGSTTRHRRNQISERVPNDNRIRSSLRTSEIFIAQAEMWMWCTPLGVECVVTADRVHVAPNGAKKLQGARSTINMPLLRSEERELAMLSKMRGPGYRMTVARSFDF